ncbi:type IV secretion system protein [Variovorax sp. Sphag1AA]|uniref:type IV secretion system protein n=1 Tax=Variovorax sp. Sphag1AA TaxID=2587027 RepID=UPI0017F68492|nr:type IV secretion system protein [Variovorax sp. Sphag1AA]MBB3175648.1 hypothetical protein [Variovorax sp. Sphag1AA]
MPITDVSNFVFFQLINDYLRDEINTFQWNLLTSTAQFIGAIGLMLLSVWIALQGFRVVTGRSRQPMMALVGDSLRAVLILGIATGAAGVSSNLYWALTDGTASGITALVSQHADSPYANIDKNLAYMQGMFSAIDSLASGGDPSVESAKSRALWFSGIGIAGPGVIGGSLLLLNKIALALFVGFGPLFVLCLLFQKTRALFEKWLLYGIGTVFSLAVLSFMVGLANNIVQAVAMSFLARFAVLLADPGSLGDASTAGEGITSLAMQQGGIGLVLTTLIVSTPPMAAAFFRGVLGQFQVFSAFGMIGRGTQAAGYASHSRRAAVMADHTKRSSNPIGESEGQLMTGRRLQGAPGHSNAALDYIKLHEWSDLSNTSFSKTRGAPAETRAIANANESDAAVEPKIVGVGTNAQGRSYYEWSTGAETTQIRMQTLTAYSLEPLRISRTGPRPETQYSIGISGTIFVPITPIGIPAIGIGGGASIGISTDGSVPGTSLFGQVQANAMVGVGAFAGIGLAPGVSRSEASPGKGWTTSTSGYFEADAGWGMSGGIAGSIDEGAKISSGSLGVPLKAIPGVGYGAAAGIGVSTSSTYASQPLGNVLGRVHPAPVSEEEKR